MPSSILIPLKVLRASLFLDLGAQRAESSDSQSYCRCDICLNNRENILVSPKLCLYLFCEQ